MFKKHKKSKFTPVDLFPNDIVEDTLINEESFVLSPAFTLTLKDIKEIGECFDDINNVCITGLENDCLYVRKVVPPQDSISESDNEESDSNVSETVMDENISEELIKNWTNQIKYASKGNSRLVKKIKTMILFLDNTFSTLPKTATYETISDKKVIRMQVTCVKGNSVAAFSKRFPRSKMFVNSKTGELILTIEIT